MLKSRRAGSGLVLVDPGCMEALGHHPEIDGIIKDHCDSRGIDAQVFVGRGCDEAVVQALKAHAVMSPSVYIRVPPHPAKTEALLEELNEASFDDLQKNLNALEDGATILVHTATHWHLMAFARFARDHREKKYKFRFLLRLPYNFSALQESISDASADVIRAYLQKTFAQWNEFEGDVKFFTDTPDLAAQYQKISGAPFGRVPIQVDFRECAPIAAAKKNKDKGPVFLLAGNARREKGFGLLPGAIESYYGQGGRGSFVIQSIDSWEEETGKELAKFGARVAVLGKALPRKDYFRLLQSSDAVLAAYDPASYRLRTSHILIEALGAGRPVVATKGTWMEDELNKYGAEAPGVLVKQYTGEALGRALLEFEKNQSKIQRRALEIAEAVRGAHNAKAFIDALL